MPVHNNRRASQRHHKTADTGSLFLPVAGSLKLVRQQIDQRLKTPYPRINSLVENIGAGEGKLFRPAMTLLSGLLCGSVEQDHLAYAAIIEMIHVATLLHDDVIDQADTRRSLPTINSRQGNTAAVLLGDFLLSRAFLAGSDFNNAEAEKLLCRTADRICQGELLQNAHQGDVSLGRRDYFRIIEAKTASLFSAACVLGAIGSNADSASKTALACYGQCVGIAFQITDDILDIIGDDKTVGKTLGTDFEQRKLTLPFILHLSRTKIAQRVRCLESLAQMSKCELVEQLSRSKALLQAGMAAKSYVKKATASLRRFKSSDAKHSLEQVAKAIAARV